MKRLLTLSIAVLLAFVQVASAQLGSSSGGGSRAQQPTVDRRIGPMLTQLGYRWEIDADGDYRMVLPIPNSDRTQIVWVISKTQRLGNLEIREIWAPAFKPNGPVPERIANMLLQKNHDMKLGAWRIISTGVVVFAAHIGAEVDAATLQTTIRNVMLTADQMEEEITGKDDW